jgi:hypothetical protein
MIVYALMVKLDDGRWCRIGTGTHKNMVTAGWIPHKRPWYITPIMRIGR